MNDIIAWIAAEAEGPDEIEEALAVAGPQGEASSER